jgi:hypothetical protein
MASSPIKPQSKFSFKPSDFLKGSKFGSNPKQNMSKFNPARFKTQNKGS